jgi:hypothetical protein
MNWSRVCAGPTSWAGSVAVLLVLRQLLIFAISLFPFEALDWFLLQSAVKFELTYFCATSSTSYQGVT